MLVESDTDKKEHTFRDSRVHVLREKLPLVWSAPRDLTPGGQGRKPGKLGTHAGSQTLF